MGLFHNSKGEAELLSHGFLGGDLQTKISTFQYTATSDISVKVRATVQETGMVVMSLKDKVLFFPKYLTLRNSTIYDKYDNLHI